MSDRIREFLAARGCADDVVAGGLDGLVDDWERTVREVEDGYGQGLDDYLTDLDARQMAEEALALAHPEDRMAAQRRLERADARMKPLVKRIFECLWGERVADAENWSPERNWWYWSIPREPGPELRDDLGG